MALRTAPERGRLLPDGRGPPHPDRLLGQKHGLKLLGELSARRNLELLHQPLDEGITQNAVQERVREDIVVDAAILRMEVGCGMLLVATVVHTASPSSARRSGCRCMRPCGHNHVLRSATRQRRRRTDNPNSPLSRLSSRREAGRIH